MDDFSQKPADQESNSDQTKAPERGSSWIGALAIIIAILAIIAASFSWEEYQSVTTKDTSNQASDTAIHVTLKNKIQQLEAQLNVTQQNVLQLMHSRAGNNQQQTLSQIAYLLNLANLQLIISHDDQAAEALLKQAQSKVDALNDSRFFELNKALLANLQTLKTDGAFNLTALITNIDLLSNGIMNSSLIPNKKDLNKSERKSEEVIAMKDADVHTWYERLWYHLSTLKDLIIIRHNDPKLIPLLDSEQQVLVKSLLQNKLLLVEYAAIRHNNNLYQNQLKMVGQWITTYYFNSIDRQNLLTQVDTLRSINVAPHISNLNDSITLLNTLMNTNQPALQTAAPTLTFPAKETSKQTTASTLSSSLTKEASTKTSAKMPS